MIKGIPMTLGDGREYIVPPLTLGALEDNQEAIEASTDELSATSIRAMIDIAHAALRRNYPELTRGDVRELIDVAIMGDVFTACMDVSGLKRKAMEDAAAGEPTGADQA